MTAVNVERMQSEVRSPIMNANLAALDANARKYTERRSVDLSSKRDACVASLNAYVQRRIAKGATVTVVAEPFVNGPYTRATLVINGTRRRVWNFASSPRVTWRYA